MSTSWSLSLRGSQAQLPSLLYTTGSFVPHPGFNSTYSDTRPGVSSSAVLT